MPPTRLDYCTAKFFPTVMDTTSAPPKMVKNYMNESYEKKDVIKNVTEKIYYVYHQKTREWAVYMAGENKIGAKREAKGLEKVTLFLDQEITYPKLTDEGLPSGQDNPVTNARALNYEITQSLTDYPRDYVLVNKDGAHMSTDSFNKSLFRSTGKHLHQNILRATYVFHWYKMKLVPPDTLEQIAYYMRHSVSEAVASYSKVNVPRYIGKNIHIEVDVPTKVTIVEKEHKPYFNPKEYSKKYRKGMVNIGGVEEKVDDAVKKERDDKRKVKYAENKDKILLYKNLLNYNKGITQPTQRTIDKYKLTKDGNVWSSSLM